MKSIFIQTRYEGKIDLSRIQLKKLPEKIALVSTVQFSHFLDEIKVYLEENKKKVYIEQGAQEFPGQILGCEQSAATKNAALVDAFLFVGDGFFHSLGLKLKTSKEVFIFNPISNEFKKTDKKTVEKIKMKKKAQLIKFYSSNEIGVIISLKPGQTHLDEARRLTKKYPEKHFYLLLFDNIDYSQLENFNFIEMWINTACPRIEEDIKVLNIEDIR